MNTSPFMDKQIMDLSSSSPPSSTDFIDLTNTNTNNSRDDDHQKQQNRIGDDNGLESKKEPIVASYDFQPIRPYTAGGLSHSALDLAGSTTTSTAARVWSVDDPKTIPNSSNRGFGSLDSIEPAKLVSEKAQNVPNTAVIMSEIDKTMKKHADTLLHVMEGVSARLTQLETRTHDLENLVDDLKVSVENSHGSTDGKMRKLENILLEVRSGVQHLKDKQEILDAQLQLSKLEPMKAGQNPKTNSLPVDPIAKPPSASVPTLQMPQFPMTSFPQPPSSAAVAPPSQQQILQPPSSQLLAQLSPQQEPYSHSQPPPPNQLPYQGPPQTQTLQPPHQPPYQPPPQQPQYPQQPSSYNNPEEQPPYPPMQSYPPNLPRQQPPPPAGSAPPSQQFYNTPQPQPSMYDGGASGRFNSGYSSEPYSYTGSPKPPHSGTGGYPQLSNPRPLPHALPMASAVNNNSSGSSSPRSQGRVPLEDVIDRVTTMGFPRNQVRETVRKLTDNGQAVDLNVVLDKLMNPGGGGGGGAPREGWYGGQPF